MVKQLNRSVFNLKNQQTYLTKRIRINKKL